MGPHRLEVGVWGVRGQKAEVGGGWRGRCMSVHVKPIYLWNSVFDFALTLCLLWQSYCNKFWAFCAPALFLHKINILFASLPFVKDLGPYAWRAINHFTAPACTVSGLNDARTRLQTVYFPILWHLFSVLCVLIKILSHATAKKETKRLKGQVQG